MKPKTTYHRTKSRLAKAKMERIKDKNIRFNFMEAIRLNKEIEKFRKAYSEAIQSDLEAEKCKSSSWKVKCNECQCHKLKTKTKIWKKE